jgi:hypothetical protein
MKQKGVGLIAAGLTLISLILIQPGCQKDSDGRNRSSSSVEGLWVGLYTVDGQLGQRYYSFVVNPDGTIINDTKAENQQHLSIGSWTLTGDTFECAATCVFGLPERIGVTEIYTATFDKANGTLINGIWKTVPPINGSGTFTLTKVK